MNAGVYVLNYLTKFYKDHPNKDTLMVVNSSDMKASKTLSKSGYGNIPFVVHDTLYNVTADWKRALRPLLEVQK